MNAQHHQEAQPAMLPGFEPPADQPARFAVMGLLRDPARVLVDYTSCSVLLQVCIVQFLRAHPEARHIVATWRYPDLGDVHTTEAAARDLAARMPRGAEVVASGSAMFGHSHQGEHVTLLADVRGIALADHARQLIEQPGPASVTTSTSTPTPTPAYGGTPA